MKPRRDACAPAVSDDVASAARQLGRTGGVKRAQKLTPEQRSAIAKQAADIRWWRTPHADGSQRKVRLYLGDIDSPQRPKRRIHIQLPEQPPEPPPSDCELCEQSRPFYRFSYHKRICDDCVQSRGWSNGIDYRDWSLLAAAKAVVRRLSNGDQP